MKKILFFLTLCVCFDFVSGALAAILVFFFCFFFFSLSFSSMLAIEEGIKSQHKVT